MNSESHLIVAFVLNPVVPLTAVTLEPLVWRATDTCRHWKRQGNIVCRKYISVIVKRGGRRGLVSTASCLLSAADLREELWTVLDVRITGSLNPGPSVQMLLLFLSDPKISAKSFRL